MVPTPAVRTTGLAAVVSLIMSAAVVAQTEPAKKAARDTTKAVSLQEVVVSASGFEQEKKDAPASITVLKRAQLEKQRNNSLAEALADVEGIDVGGTVGKTGGMNIGMRGMPSDYTLVLIDGRRQNAAGNVTPNGFGETSTSFLPPVSAIDRIEVIRGPMATLYGSDAIGGVINIITRKVSNRWRGSLTSDATVQGNTEFGNTYSGNVYLNGPVLPGRLGLAVRGSLLKRAESDLNPTGEFADATEISKRGPSPVEADIYSVGGRLTLTPGAAHDVWFDVEIARQRYENGEAQLGTLDRPDATPPTFNGYGPEQKFYRDALTLAHTWRFGAGILESSIMRNATETIGRTLPAGTPGGPPGSGAPNKVAGSPRQLEATNTVIDTRLTAGAGRHVFTVGGQYWDAEMIDGVALAPFTFTQWSAFAEDEWRFVRDLALTAGVRYDDHSSFGSHVSPRAYLVWTANQNWTLKGGVSGGYKTPRLEQLVDGITGFTAQGRTATIGSPGLKPETSVSTELAVLYGNQSGWSAGVSVFNNNFNDKIASGTPVPNCTFQGNPNAAGCVNYGNFPTQETFGQAINIDKAVTRGFELSGRVPFSQAVSLQGNYTYTESEQKSGSSEGWPLTNTPKHMLNGTVRADLGRTVGTWVRGEYRSSRARRLSEGANAAYDALGDFKAYGLLHLGGSFQLVNGVTINATIYNLLDTDFLQYASYQGTPSAANPTGILYTNVYNNHQEGRRIWLSTNLSF